ncbi:MAG: hypothetical protein RM022_032395 [Nostoc sp. EfeVER01]|uniref:hypothetical protein n=1 Tax=unclassified Nostoc TaxID=2593658 RepID=UPI002AD5B47E|nr:MULTISPECIES: hypothetical protein [unclassified Nostoc]MDZ7947451.1 hypothetical protein [Nostoc sp. EfeVER01]MDZ7993243.1 hypothetical protein [Nostoc sp. EspVER01]
MISQRGKTVEITSEFRTVVEISESYRAGVGSGSEFGYVIVARSGVDIAIDEKVEIDVNALIRAPIALSK